ncbi:uncharacterized protein LOC143026614 [Oratosquilla oratoria]|uniref:uncharacterized protein LOC143026614 n=1 Tax=Oratosquilla oratoria TaxID=337810 RepID=UPI003F75B046
MAEENRVGSAQSSRRRRWELHSRESFETSLAVEYSSPRDSFKANTKSTESRQRPRSTQKSKLPRPKSSAEEKGKKRVEESHHASATSEISNNRFEEELMQEVEKDLLNSKLSAIIDDASKTKKSKNTRTPTPQAEEKHKDKIEDGVEYEPEDKFRPSAPSLSPEYINRKSVPTFDPSLSQSVICQHLKAVSEDVVDVESLEKEKDTADPFVPYHLEESEKNKVISTIFKENASGFVLSSESSIDGNAKMEDLPVEMTETRKAHALNTQRGFRSFAVFCQGFLAGITFTHCIMIFLLDEINAAIGSAYSSTIAQVFFAVIIFLTTICLVATCDRCDIGSLKIISGHNIKVPWCPAIYLTCLVLSLVAIKVEDILAHTNIYPSEMIDQVQGKVLEWWKWICVSRTALAVLGWLAVVPDPHTDALLMHIKTLAE